jgi:formamidopyrimidine-DNA glycosylase
MTTGTVFYRQKTTDCQSNLVFTLHREWKTRNRKMPELPEVQTIVNDLNAAGLVGTTIIGAGVFWPRMVSEPPFKVFCRRVKGQKISAIRRRAKYIVFNFTSGNAMLIHLRMSGRLHLATPAAARLKHEHVVLSLDDGRQLRFHDTRKFGRIFLVDDPDKILRTLGPEPLDAGFTAKKLAIRLGARQRRLKPLLLDQTFIAGLGNIYVDEALWEAKLHPCRSASSLSSSEMKLLHRAITRVLRRGLDNLGTSLGTGKTTFYSVARRRGRNGDKLKVFRRQALPCPRCRAPIERIVVGQRSTHICPKCQKKSA